jgi:hypothetical protein
VTAFVQFVKGILVLLVVSWCVCGYPLYLWKGPEWVLAAGVGCIICTVNALVGGGVALWGMNKSQTVFFAAVFGGMGVRVFLVITFFLIALKLAKLHVFGLTLSLFLFYVMFQILEIRFFARCSSGGTQRVEGN